MSRPVRLRVSGNHRDLLSAHLFPPDGFEAVAFALCGRHRSAEFDVLLVQEVILIPYDECRVRTPDRVVWSTQRIELMLFRARQEHLGIVKFHSHPGGYGNFSAIDDESDRAFFENITSWLCDDLPHASVVMVPGGRMVGRVLSDEREFAPLERIVVAGHDIEVAASPSAAPIRRHAERHAQLFGEATTRMLGSLRIGVVGCSGTGSFVVELLGRLGVQALVLVDADHVEHRNLNRIVNATLEDAEIGRPKVDVLARAVRGMGTGTEVFTIPALLETREAVSALASCDIVFGCVDTHSGRRTLNRLADFYVLPYIDCGVGLNPDGVGGISQVCAAAHYVQPGGASLLQRGAINQNTADAQALKQTDPDEYAKRRAQNYIPDVEVVSPAVASINMLASALAVNEMIARLHPYRNRGNSASSVRFSLSIMHVYLDRYEVTERSRDVGRGDVSPLLDMPALAAGWGW